jgi:L-lactate utilization protein LutB
LNDFADNVEAIKKEYKFKIKEEIEALNLEATERGGNFYFHKNFELDKIAHFEVE